LVLIPFMTAWSWEMRGGLLFISLITMVYWTFDIPLSFCTAVVIDGELVEKRRMIAYHYLRGWLLFDIGVISLDWMMLLLILTSDGDSEGLTGLQAARMFRLLRLIKLQTFEHALEDRCIAMGMQSLVLIAKMVKIILVILATSHLFACMLYFVGSLAEFGKPELD